MKKGRKILHFREIKIVCWCEVLSILLILQSAVLSKPHNYIGVLEEKSYVYAGCYTARNDLLQQTAYIKMPHTCVDICEHQEQKYAVLSGEKCFCSDTVVAWERQDNHLCNTLCLDSRTAFCGGMGMHSYYTTAALAKSISALHKIWVANATENSLTVAWSTDDGGDGESHTVEKPTQILATQGPTNFLIKSHIVKTYSSMSLFRQPEFIVQGTEMSFELTDLLPATEYNVSVFAMCGPTVCGSNTLRGTTIVDQPSPAPKQPNIVERINNTITIEIPPIHNDNGPVSQILVIVEYVNDALSQSFDSLLLGSWQKAQTDGLPYYITAELAVSESQQNRSQLFVVGDGKQYGSYTNIPLDTVANGEDDRHVHISLGVVSTLNGVTRTLYARGIHDQHSGSTIEDFTYATFDSGRESIIALAVTCVVFACCLLLSLITYVYLRYRACQARNSRLRNTHEMTMQQPIIEQENSGFIVENDLQASGNFKQQLNDLLENLDATKRLHRNTLRMNVNDILAEGRYGEVIAGSLMSGMLPESSAECQLHVLALDDLSDADQAYLLYEFRNITKLQSHESLFYFFGVSASSDWFYFVFEHQTVSLKRHLIQSRRTPHTSPVQRITAMSEQLILQWIYELASAMEYLGKRKVVHRQLCSHNVFVTVESRLKLSVFGPIHYANHQKQKIDISRWLAPEVLRYQHYSSKSDIWAFACVAWECTALGGTPYANINSTMQLLDAIRSGSRPAQPVYVYHDLYQLLLNAWQLEPSDRTSFEDIALGIRQLMTSPKHAINFDRMPEISDNNVLDTLPFYLPMLEIQN